MATLKGRDITANISIDDIARPYRADSTLAGKSYHIGRWAREGVDKDGKPLPTLGFTCAPEVYKAFKIGNIEQITVVESSYDRKDPTTGTMVPTASATLVSWLTLDQVMALDKNETKLITSRTELVVAKAKSGVAEKHATFAAMKEFGLSMEEMEFLKQEAGA